MVDYENNHIDCILIGTYESATPFSEARFLNNLSKPISDSPIRLRKEELAGLHDGFFEPTLTEGLCYVIGRLIGWVAIPVDAGITIYNSLKDRSFEKLREDRS